MSTPTVFFIGIAIIGLSECLRQTMLQTIFVID